MKPLVSIVVICYNYGQYLREAVESALTQTYPNIEIIIIDDGSTDDSPAIAAALVREHKSIRYVPQDNHGVVYTRNRAITEVKGDYYIQLDADDYLDADYIEKTIDTAMKNNADIVYTNYKQFGDIENTSNFPEYNFEELKNRNFIHISSLIRTDSVGDVRFDEKLTGMTHEDWEFFLHLCSDGKRAVLRNDTYLNYRMHGAGRNNTLQLLSQARKYVDVYSYITRKRIQEGKQADFEYLAILPLGDWYADLDNQLQATREESQSAINRLNQNMTEAQHKVAILQQQNGALQHEINQLVNSKSYRIGRKLLLPARVSKRAHRKLRREVAAASKKQSDMAIDRAYNQQIDAMAADIINTFDKFAVTVHLFYTDNWPLFLRKLKLLPRDQFDLFITLPKHNASFIDVIKEDFPDVVVLISANQGRDVLPFVKMAKLIHSKGYYAILKFHSKKSTHRSDGQEWLELMLDEIIPEDAKKLSNILKLIKKDTFGVLGPRDVYYPLTVNFPANSTHLNTVLSKLYSPDKASEILENRKQYGFFGGTMFWVSTDTIADLLNFDSASYFEKEASQVDGTFAHALERLFCVVPEIEGKKIYEADGAKINERAYQSKNIPDWSEDHDK